MGSLAAGRFVSQWKETEEELRRQNEILQTIFDHIPVMINFFGPDGRLLLVNRHWEKVKGWTLEEAQQVDLLAESYLDPEERRRALEQIRNPTHRWVDFRTRVRDGRILDISWANVLLSDGTSIGIGQDVTERKLVEEKIQEYYQRVEALSRRLLTVQEEERRHLARELHDEIGQSLTGLQFILEAGPQLSEAAVRSKLQDARAGVDRLLARVRELSFDLRPAMLDHLGLLSALLWLFERYTSQTNVRVHFRHEGVTGRFAAEIETTAFRLIQEALTNVARHAGVTDVSVRVWRQEGFLQLQVEDEGVGFILEAALASHKSAGLTGMHERVQLLGGRLVIASVPGEGTQLMFWLPLSL